MFKVSTVIPRVSCFNDQDETRVILSTKSNRYIRYFNKYVKEQLSPVEASFSGVTLIKLLDQTLHWNRSLQTKRHLALTTIRLVNAKSIDEFEKLDSRTQQEIVASYYTLPSISNHVQSCADKAFVRLLNMTKFPVHAKKEFSKATIHQYVESARKSHALLTDEEKSSVVANIDYSMPADDFRRNVARYFKNYRLSVGMPRNGTYMVALSPYYTQILIMLRAVYGEEKLFEVLERFDIADTLLCPTEIVDLLENWEKLQAYPQHWIKQIHEMHHEIQSL